jgi:PEP-CTERM motif
MLGPGIRFGGIRVLQKSWFNFLLPLGLALACGTASAGPISLGSIVTNNIAVLGFDPSFSSSTSVNVTNAGGSTINVTGNVVSPSVTGGSGLTFTAGSQTFTSGPVLTNAETDLQSVVSQLGALSYSTLTLTSGATNIISTPGNYTINGVLGAGTVIDLTGSGQYVFKTSGNLTLTSVTINGNAGLSSDNVFWFTPGTVNITNSKVFGDVVQSSGANNVLQASTGLTGSLTGRFLSEAFTTGLTAAQASTLNINDFQADAPEPSTLALISLGLIGLATGLRRRVVT